jgi:F-type H+-transporting ATPase subunit b
MNLNATLIVEVLSFLILVGLLTKLLYRPLLSFLDERAQRIKEAIEEAEKNRNLAQAHLDSALREINKAKEEALEIKKKAKIESEEARKRLLDTAQTQARELREKMRQELTEEENRLTKELRRKLGELSIMIAEKLLAREIKDKDQKKLIDETLKELER